MEKFSFFMKYKASSSHSFIITSLDKSYDFNLLSRDPYDYFNNDSLMIKDNIIAAGNLGSMKDNNQLYYYPYSTYVLSMERGKGYGKLLYLTMIAAVGFLNKNSRIKPLLAQHNAIQPFINPITISASRVYKSLEKLKFIKSKGLIKTISSIDNKFIHKSYLFQNKGEVFEIEKYPMFLKFEFLNKDNDKKIYRIISNEKTDSSS